MTDHQFKVGDQLVAINHHCDDLFVVDRIGRNGEIYDSQWRMLNIQHFRLADAEEIAAKKRLKVT